MEAVQKGVLSELRVIARNVDIWMIAPDCVNPTTKSNWCHLNNEQRCVAEYRGRNATGNPYMHEKGMAITVFKTKILRGKHRIIIY